ncbi:MAG: glycosyltransferase [Candidatus Thorarchaeota archaeon]
MDLIYQIYVIIRFILNLIVTIEFLIVSISLIIFYHIFFYFIRDKKYVIAFKKFEDKEGIKFKNFEQLPLFNIIIPAWKEGEVFRKCLKNIFTLDYPNLKVIINVGGNEETINIANSFRNHGNLEILFQKKGGGKVKAINDCISHVKEGIICLIDADIYLTDEDLLKMLNVIENKEEYIVAASLKPHHTQVTKSFVRYLFINRNTRFRIKVNRYTRNAISQCTLIKLEVINKVGNFTERRLIGDGQSMGLDIVEKNYRIYQLNSQGVQSFNYPYHLKEYFSQNVRWVQNTYFNIIKNSKKRIFIYILLIIEATYLVVFPIFLFFNFGLFLIGILLLINIYFKKIRKILFFKRTSDRTYFGKNKLWFYIFIIFFIYLDNLIQIYTVLEIIIRGDKKYRKRKNIE